jgi:multiple sugar transport system permease protein
VNASTATARRRASTPSRRLTREVVETRVLGVLKWVVIGCFLVATLFPFYYMVLLSIRAIDQVILHPNQVLVPLRELTFSAYRSVLRSTSHGGQGFVRFIVNSGLVALATVLITVAVAIPGAYAVSRLRFFGKRPIHYLFFAVYLFPAIVLAIPLFVLFSRLGLRGSLPTLVIVYVSQTLPVSIFMLRNYLETVPRSLEEAAAVDGATRLKTIWRVSIPLAMPAIMATALYVFMIAWNEFLFALLFLVERRENWTVSLGLSQLDTIETPKTVLMAGSVILTIPVVILFFFTERLLVEGLTSGAEKG